MPKFKLQMLIRGRCMYLVELDTLLRHFGPRGLKTEDPELSLYQVGSILLHGGNIKCQPPEVRVEGSWRDDIYKKGESMSDCGCVCLWQTQMQGVKGDWLEVYFDNKAFSWCGLSVGVDYIYSLLHATLSNCE